MKDMIRALASRGNERTSEHTVELKGSRTRGCGSIVHQRSQPVSPLSRLETMRRRPSSVVVGWVMLSEKKTKQNKGTWRQLYSVSRVQSV